MDTLGFSSNNPDIIAATLADRMREVIGSVSSFIEFAGHDATDFNRLVEKLPTPAQAAPSGPVQTITLDELEALARRKPE